MKKLRLLIVLAAFMAVLPAAAQLRFGVKAGADFNSLDVKDFDYVKENSTAYTAGVMVDFTVPLIGVGVDASVMFTRRSVPKNVHFMADDNGTNVIVEADVTNKNFIEVPINLKYALSLPAISSIVKPFVATGPTLAFNISGKDNDKAIDLHKADVSWRVGAGVELIRHIQVGVSYRWGLTNLNKSDLNWAGHSYDYRSNGWSVTAAYLF